MYINTLPTNLKRLVAITFTTVVALLCLQLSQFTFATEGTASWYGPNFAGKLTANGEIYNPRELTAAHQSMAFNTIVQVTNLQNGQSVTVRINDRGPFVGNRIIDLSEAAAERIDMKYAGLATVHLSILQAGDVPDVITPVDTATYGLTNSAVLNAVATNPMGTNATATGSTGSIVNNNYSTTNYAVANTVTAYPSQTSVNQAANSQLSNNLAANNQMLGDLRLIPNQAINYSYDALDVLASASQATAIIASAVTGAVGSRPYVGTVVGDVSISHTVTKSSVSVGLEEGSSPPTSSTTPTLAGNSALTIQIMPGLSKQEVILENYPIGAQLLLAAATGEQTWVQVISSQLPPEVSDTFLISEELATFLGTNFELLAQR